MAKKAVATVDTSKVLQLNPADILADDNIRFGILDSAVSNMTASIVDLGGVQEPVTVTPSMLADGPKYRLLKGFIRHAAVTKLNAEAGAGLTLPAIVRAEPTPVERLKLQVAENVNRTEMSPIDIAVTAARMLEAGMSRLDVRQQFPLLKKGGVYEAASNAWLNIHLAMLNLPDSVQDEIHEGRVSKYAAYELSKVPADRILPVLEKAKAALAAQFDKEEADEDKTLKALKKQEEAEAKAAERDAKIQEARDQTLLAQQNEAGKLEALRKVQAIAVDPKDEAAQRAHTEASKAAEADLKAAQKLNKEAAKKVTTLVESKAKSDKAAAEAREKIAQAAKAAAPRVGDEDVKRAAAADAKETGAGTGHIALTAAQVKQALKDIKSENKLVAATVAVFARMVSGELTPKQAQTELEGLFTPKGVPAKTGPVAVPTPAPAPAPAPAAKKHKAPARK